MSNPISLPPGGFYRQIYRAESPESKKFRLDLLVRQRINFVQILGEAIRPIDRKGNFK